VRRMRNQRCRHVTPHSSPQPYGTLYSPGLEKMCWSVPWRSACVAAVQAILLAMLLAMHPTSGNTFYTMHNGVLLSAHDRRPHVRQGHAVSRRCRRRGSVG